MAIAASQDVNNHDGLPHDLVIGILSRLPLKSQFRCKSVCKLWFDTICTLWFDSLHLQFQKRILCETVQVYFLCDLVGYCNGFHSYFHVHDSKFIPMLLTGKVVPLILTEKVNQKITVYNTSNHTSYFTKEITHGITLGYGFGFDVKTQYYKLVHLYVDDYGYEFSRTMYTVYRLHLMENRNKFACAEETFTLSPKNSSSMSPSSSESSLQIPLGKSWSFGEAIFWKEALCWKTRNPQEMILFHLHEEKFQVIRQRQFS